MTPSTSGNGGRHGSLRLALCALALAVAESAGGQGLAVDGREVITVQLPASALVESYRNTGYDLAVDGGRATITVDLTPLGSAAPFELPPPSLDPDAVERLGRGLARGSTTRYQAVSAILAWIAAEIRYDLDRAAPQDPATVLARRAGYCTGLARLAVALLEALDIPAREVAGYVVEAGEEGRGGYHRWIEVYYGDRGWVFSDPSKFHHFVPARYVRLASPTLLPGAEIDRGTLVARSASRLVVDLAPSVPNGVELRRNEDHRHSAALGVEVRGPGPGFAILEGGGTRRRSELVGGRGFFVGIEPGAYRLTVHGPDSEPRSKDLVFRGRVFGEIFFEEGG